MADLSGPRRWRLRALFILLAGLIYFVHLLPLRTGPGGWPAPDFVALIGFVWVLRRSTVMPILLFAAMVLLGDFLLMRPLGLWTAVAVLGLEFLRTREPTSRDMPLPVEWAMVAGVLALMYAAQALALAVFVADQPRFSLTAAQFILTVLAYPLVVLATRHGLGLRKALRPQSGALGVWT